MTTKSALVALHLTFLMLTIAASLRPTGETDVSPEQSALDPIYTIRQPRSHWFFQFAYNVFGYFVLMLPGAILVYAVKKRSCPPKIANIPLVRLFVFGKQSSPQHYHRDIEERGSVQDVGSSSDDENDAFSKSNSTIPRGYSYHSTSSKQRKRPYLKLVYCFVGLQLSFLTWGVLQEKIMTTEYVVTVRTTSSSTTSSLHNESSELSTTTNKIYFHDSQFLVLVNRILAFIAASAILITRRFTSRKRRGDRLIPQSGNKTTTATYEIAPLYLFSFCSISNILSSWCQYEALKYVNFPTQVLSKACKLLPVMMMSRLVSGKRYRPLEYFIAVVISAGMCLFLLFSYDEFHHHHNSIRSINNGKTGSSVISYSLFDGLIILSLYLTFDSFTSNWQERVSRDYNVSSLQMMAFVNLFSIVFTLTSLAQQRSLIPSLELTLSSWPLARDCLILSLCSATGQLFIFYTISTFGAFTFTFMMTLRQTFAIILSCVIYGHSLSGGAILGVSIVFSGLFGQIYLKFRSKSSSSRAKS